MYPRLLRYEIALFHGTDRLRSRCFKLINGNFNFYDWPGKSSTFSVAQEMRPHLPTCSFSFTCTEPVLSYMCFSLESSFFCSVGFLSVETHFVRSHTSHPCASLLRGVHRASVAWGLSMHYNWRNANCTRCYVLPCSFHSALSQRAA